MKLLVIAILAVTVSSQCCNKFVGWKCEECPKGTHLYKGHCLFNIPNCLSYVEGFDCQACDSGYEIKDGECK